MRRPEPAPGRACVWPVVGGLWLACMLGLAVACTGRSQASAAPDAQDAQVTPSPVAWSVQERERYMQRMQAADAIADDAQRCLAYPDLPGQRWLPGAAAASCAFLRPNPWTLDRMEAELARPDGARRLDAAFAALAVGQTDHGDPGDALFAAHGALQADARSRALAEAWRAAAPRSPHALSALGHVWLGSAFKARGGQLARATSDAQWQAMQRDLQQARPLFEAALAAEPGYVPACIGLIRIARLSSDDALKRQAVAQCDKAGGASFAVMQARKTAAEARWGGSAREREAVNGDIALHVARNPALGILLSDGDAERGLELARQKRWDEAFPLLQSASLRAPHADVLANAGHVARRLKRPDDALIYLTQAVRFHPDMVWYRRWLSRVHADQQHWDAALAELDRARQRAPEVRLGKEYARIGWHAEEHGDHAVAKQAYAQALEDPDTRQEAAIALCDIAVRRERDPARALRCTQANAAQYPREPMALFMRAWVLTEQQQPGAAQAAQAFFDLPDGLDERQAQMRAQLQALRGAAPAR